jgi:hypothetical protein
MGAPYKPSEFRTLIVDESDTVCTALRKFLKFSVFLYKFFKWKYKANGDFTDEYKAMLCSINCPTDVTPL